MNPGGLDPPGHDLMGGRWNGRLEDGTPDMQAENSVPDTGQRDTFPLGSPAGFVLARVAHAFVGE